jgi:pyrroloquinoline quinone (PQQ) biosynthesis protein C
MLRRQCVARTSTEMHMEVSSVRTGPMMELQSYPPWIQDIVAECNDARRGVVEHECFQLMRDGALSPHAMRMFLAGAWPVIEQFPQYMAMNLLKVQYGFAPGHEMARKYLIRNIRVEQNHVEYWTDWAQAHGLSEEELFFGRRSTSAEALSHWCWHTCERDPLPVAMAATNYAIEGATGEWAALVCSSADYESGFKPEARKRAMQWLRVHAQYDDKHPWQALEIIATLVGKHATARDISGIESSIRKSYEYMRMMFDDCLVHEQRGSTARVHKRAMNG